MTQHNDEHERLEELLKELAETKKIGPKLIEKGRRLTEAGQSALDWAKGLQTLAENSPDGFFDHPLVKQVSNGFREFNSGSTAG